jgi:folylpolyglutamate synthase/dihydropteroate synthase
VVLTASGNPRAAAPEALRAFLPADLPVEVAPSPAEALARATAEAAGGIVCVAGSLSLIGDVLAAAADGQDVLFTSGARC